MYVLANILLDELQGWWTQVKDLSKVWYVTHNTTPQLFMYGRYTQGKEAENMKRGAWEFWFIPQHVASPHHHEQMRAERATSLAATWPGLIRCEEGHIEQRLSARESGIRGKESELENHLSTCFGPCVASYLVKGIVFRDATFNFQKLVAIICVCLFFLAENKPGKAMNLLFKNNTQSWKKIPL